MWGGERERRKGRRPSSLALLLVQEIDPECSRTMQLLWQRRSREVVTVWPADGCGSTKQGEHDKHECTSSFISVLSSFVCFFVAWTFIRLPYFF